MFQWIQTAKKSISALIGGTTYNIASDHPNFEQISKAAEQGNEADFVRLADVPAALESYTLGSVEVRGGQVLYNGNVLENVVTRRILNMMSKQIPFEPMVRFLQNLMLNPSKRAISELYSWLEHQDIPITTDGYWLGYKRVDADYLDLHTRKVDNHVGQQPTMDRNAVDDNWGIDCSNGFHIGSMGYVGTFGNKSSNHLMIAKVNPRDTVTVPHDETSKCRVCTYTVIGEYEHTLEWPVYDAPGPNQPIRPVTNIPRKERPVQQSTSTCENNQSGGSTNGSTSDDDNTDGYGDYTVIVTLTGKTSSGVQRELNDIAGVQRELNDIADDAHSAGSGLVETMDATTDRILFDFDYESEANQFISDIEDLSYVADAELRDNDATDDDSDDADEEDEELVDHTALLHLSPMARFELRQRAVNEIMRINNISRYDAEVLAEGMSRLSMTAFLPLADRHKFIDPSYTLTAEELYPISFDVFSGDLKVGHFNVCTVDEEASVMQVSSSVYTNCNQRNRVSR